MRVGLYARISEDIEGLALGVARQEADGRAVAKLRGWEVAGVYEDNDLSAYKPKVVRPEFERLLADLECGLVDGIVAYDLDRFARQNSDLERAIALYDAKPSRVFATVQGDIDLGSSDGRTMARVMVAFANKASMDTSRRVKRKHLELARRGVPVGGNRPFGYEADKVTVRQVEADLIRWAADEVLQGLGLHTICKMWNENGVRTTRGNLWNKSVLKNMLKSPRMAGYRVYQGGIARHEDGTPVMGLYEPILQLGTWEAVVAHITDPDRSAPYTNDGKRKYLLSGVIRCSFCSSLLYGNADKRYDSHTYQCKSLGCGKVGCSAKVDELITQLVLRYLSTREIEPEDRPFDTTEIDATSGRIVELMGKYTEGTLSGDVVFPAVQKLEDRLARLRSERGDYLRSQIKRPTNAVAAWPGMNVDQRRAVIQSVLHAVVLKPPTTRGPKFDAERVEVVWREDG